MIESNLETPNKNLNQVECDILILGAGAAGLSSGIYAARAKMNTVILEDYVAGGQTSTTYHVANYPGTPGVVKGIDIIENMYNQAKSFGAKIDELKKLTEVRLDQKIKYVRTEDTEYFAKSLIIASGSKPKMLPAKNSDKFLGIGIHYCATCDGAIYKDKKVVVVGGGNSALQESVFLTRFASHVTIIHRSPTFRGTKIAQEEVFNNNKIDVIFDSEIIEIKGENDIMSGVIIENKKTKILSEILTDGIFVFIGTKPMSDLFIGQLQIDDLGYIIANEDTKTDIEGVFVAGDIRTKPIRQIVTAASDGAVAGIMAERYIIHNKI